MVLLGAANLVLADKVARSNGAVARRQTSWRVGGSARHRGDTQREESECDGGETHLEKKGAVERREKRKSVCACVAQVIGWRACQSGKVAKGKRRER